MKIKVRKKTEKKRNIGIKGDFMSCSGVHDDNNGDVKVENE
jgi:hypothetical protein